MRAAAVSALAISKVQDFDAIYIAVMNPEEYTGGANIASHVAEALGFRGIPAVRVETASSAGAAAVHVAYHGVAEGLSRLRELHQRLKPIGEKIWSNTLKQTDSFLSSSLR